MTSKTYPGFSDPEGPIFHTAERGNNELKITQFILDETFLGSNSKFSNSQRIIFSFQGFFSIIFFFFYFKNVTQRMYTHDLYCGCKSQQVENDKSLQEDSGHFFFFFKLWKFFFLQIKSSRHSCRF